MSFFFSIFGCGKSSDKSANYPLVPQFPLTDNPVCKVEPIQIDSGFFSQTFILSPDKKKVFVLAFGMEGPPEDMTYLLMRLDSDGKIENKIMLPHSIVTDVPNFWWEEDGTLSLLLETGIKNFEPNSLKTLKIRKSINFDNFISQKKKDELVYNEQVDAYAAAMKKAIADSKVHYVRRVLNLDFIMLDFANKPSEFWHLRDTEDLAPFIAQYGQQKPPMNPALDQSDGNVRVKTLAHNVLDYKMAYPNLKYIEENILELTNGKQKTRFRLSNKEKHVLRLVYADNQYLTTTDDAIWLMYERQLYRIVFGER